MWQHKKLVTDGKRGRGMWCTWIFNHLRYMLKAALTHDPFSLKFSSVSLAPVRRDRKPPLYITSLPLCLVQHKGGCWKNS